MRTGGRENCCKDFWDDKKNLEIRYGVQESDESVVHERVEIARIQRKKCHWLFIKENFPFEFVWNEVKIMRRGMCRVGVGRMRIVMRGGRGR